jgi:DIS3-like exonuclease 2
METLIKIKCTVCVWFFDCRYLVQRVIPMLPRLLCEELCSLHPGYPRFAFSIVWEVDEDGNIYKEWAGRSVISSRAKLAYPMVQQMIEGCFDPAPWGVQLHEGATWEEVRAAGFGTLVSGVLARAT